MDLPDTQSRCHLVVVRCQIPYVWNRDPQALCNLGEYFRCDSGHWHGTISEADRDDIPLCFLSDMPRRGFSRLNTLSGKRPLHTRFGGVLINGGKVGKSKVADSAKGDSLAAFRRGALRFSFFRRVGRVGPSTAGGRTARRSRGWRRATMTHPLRAIWPIYEASCRQGTSAEGEWACLFFR